jgi:cellulose biosynthesis protein BcsQ
MNVVAVFNQKGGVGKTTLAVNLAVALAGLNYKTVFIDMDFQSDGTRQLWHGAYPPLTVYDLLARRCGPEEAALETDVPNLSVIASSPRLSLVDAGDDPTGAYQTELRDNAFPRGKVDFVIVDCPPSLGRLTANALSAANFLLLPVTPSAFAMEGMKRTLGIVQSVRAGLNPELRDYRVIKDRLGQSIFGTNTHYLDCKSTSVAAGKKFTYKFTFPANLGIGSYSVAVALHASETHIVENFEWLDLALVFNVVNIAQDTFVGLSWMPPKVEIEACYVIT